MQSSRIELSDEQNFRHYGVKEATELTSSVDRHVEEISINGFSIVEDVVPEAALVAARIRIDSVYAKQAAEVGGAESLQRISDELIARCLLAYDEYFVGWATNAKVLAIVERLLGDYFILNQQNAIINFPGRENYQSSWHRDLLYQHFVATRPLAISVLFCIDDFLPETGATHVLPATHKHEKFPSREFAERHEHPISARAGSALVFDSLLFHRGGYNRSAQTRRGLNHMYALPFIKQQIDLPQMLNGRFESDRFLRRLLGYESVPGESVVDWRRKRIERASHNLS